MPLLVAMFLLYISETAVSQLNRQVVGRYEYAQYDGEWYTVAYGKKGDLVDTKHVIVRLKNKEDINAFNFSAVGLPNLKNVRGRFADGFYELEVLNGHYPFQLARLLKQTGRFDEVMFNVFFKVEATPNDPHFAQQWNLTKVSMQSSWDITVGDTNIVVAVSDNLAVKSYIIVEPINLLTKG